MATAALDLGPFILANTETTLISVPALHDYNVSSVRFLNIDSVMRTITIYEYKPPGVAADPQSPVALNFTLNPGEIYEYGPTILAATRKVTALSDIANKVTVHISGWDHS